MIYTLIELIQSKIVAPLQFPLINKIKGKKLKCGGGGGLDWGQQQIGEQEKKNY